MHHLKRRALAAAAAVTKALLGGGQPPTGDGLEANQPLRSGVCMTSSQVIHLRSIAPTAPAPDGWIYLGQANGFATYFLLTAR